MVKINSDFEFDAQDSDKLLDVMENLARDLQNIEDRQERLQSVGVGMKLSIKNEEIIVSLTDPKTSDSSK